MDSATTDALLDLQRLERALLRAVLELPGYVAPRHLEALRYAIGLASLTRFEPGAAALGRPSGRGDVDVEAEVTELRSELLVALSAPLRAPAPAQARLRGASATLASIWPKQARLRRALLERHALDFSEQELDDEVGRKVLVNAAGGGGGAGWAYLGAYQRLQEAGIVPAYVMGTSIGALVGMLRARVVDADWDAYVELIASLERRELFLPVSLRRRYGLPGLVRLRLRSSFGHLCTRPDGEEMRIGDFAIPFDTVVAGVRRQSFERLPEEVREGTDADAGASLAVRVTSRLWHVSTFFDRDVVTPIVVGCHESTAGFSAMDAIGFSCAIPGVLHFDLGKSETCMSRLLDELFETRGIAALVDGGVTSNVPVALAWRSVQEGRLGTRNAIYLGFDSFHPQWDPAHLWLQPITQAVQLQMGYNRRFAHWVIRFEPTLSPINLQPSRASLDQAMVWGREAAEAALPLIEALLEPVAWPGPPPD